MRKLELFLVPPTCAETRETVRTEPQPSESECSDDALSSKRDSVGGGAAEQARRARAPTLPGVSVSGPYGLNEVAASVRSPRWSGLASPPDSGGPDGRGCARCSPVIRDRVHYIYWINTCFLPNLPDRITDARRDRRRSATLVRRRRCVS